LGHALVGDCILKLFDLSPEILDLCFSIEIETLDILVLGDCLSLVQATKGGLRE
jgi:hypothetical protein